MFLKRKCAEAETLPVRHRGTNAFVATTLCRNSGVYQYAATFCPEVDSLRMRHKMMENLYSCQNETFSPMN